MGYYTDDMIADIEEMVDRHITAVVTDGPGDRWFVSRAYLVPKGEQPWRGAKIKVVRIEPTAENNRPENTLKIFTGVMEAMAYLEKKQ